nr:prolyl oligopeptidase family serine peptidase [Chloroflexota bacterium]
MASSPEPAMNDRPVVLLQGLRFLPILLLLALFAWFTLSKCSIEEAANDQLANDLLSDVEEPGWTVVASTVGKECAIVTADRRKVQSAEGKVLLFYEGTPEVAHLVLTSCGVKSGKAHTIYLNGEPVAQAQDDAFHTCMCNGNGRLVTYTLPDPSIVVNGWNHISVTNDADITDSWMAHNLQLIIKGNLSQAIIAEFAFTSSYDGSTRYTVYQIPIGHTPGTRVPLLVSIGGTLEDKWDALSRFAHRANVRGWLLMAPDIRQVNKESLGRTASLATQHDIMDAIYYMIRHYEVDVNRIYMSGFSTGGGVAATVAAKYPDVFAAVVAWKGPTNLLQWIEQRPQLYFGLVTYDFGCPPQGNTSACPFEWRRRAAWELVMNLKHVPMAIVHGRADDRVPFAQSREFYDRMAAFYDPIAHNKLAVWHDGGHVDSLPNFDGLDFLAQFTVNTNPRDVMIRTDESKSYYWVHVEQRDWNGKHIEGFSNVVADYDLATRVISATVWDERVFEDGTLPIDVTFDLVAMGFDPSTAYTIEDHHIASGKVWCKQDILPVEGRLTISLPREHLGEERHQYRIYPSSRVGDQTCQ